MKNCIISSRPALFSALALSVSAAAIAMPSQAWAQAAPQTAAEAPESGLEEIVVTAQRRKENLQDVPISVTAITAGNLAAGGVGNTLQLNQAVPSVQLTRSGPGAIFFIRGVGNSSGGVGEEGANAFYVDGVYLGDLNQMALEFNNIERVEVLKGPQGTLFGRNSSGGLVNIITREPGDEVVVSAKAGYGNYNTKSGQLYVASPLTDKVSADIALTGKDQGKGFGTNLFTGEDVALGWFFGLRSKVVIKPGDTTKITLAGDYTKNRNDYTNGFNLGKDSVGTGGFTYYGDYNINTPDAEYANLRTWGVSATVEHEFDWATLTSVTARRAVRVRSAFDADYVPTELVRAFVPSSVKTFQEELRLASANSTGLSWQAGVFYYTANAKVTGFELRGLGVGGLNSGSNTYGQMKTTSYAAFGEVSYDVTETTHVTGGIRYTKEKRKYVGHKDAVNLAVGSALYNAFTIPVTRSSIDYGRATYRIAVRQDLTDKVNVYASYNRGFKSGIYGTTGTPGDPPVKPQTIDAFEVGLKSQLFDNMLRFNVAGFHYKIKDYQVRSSPAPGQTLLLNAAVVKVDGIEGEVQFAPTRALRFTANAAYLDARFGSFPNNPFTYPRPATCNPAGATTPGQTTGPQTGGSITCVGSAKGNRAPLAPKFASTLAASYTMPIGDQSQLIATGLWSYTSTIFYEADNRVRQPSYSVFNASLEYRPAPTWGIELWAKNIGDKRYYGSLLGGSTGDHGELAPPRQYGVNVKFDF